MSELSDRKLRILKAIVDEYIANGVPVGSRVLSKRPELALSAATIRNEMADLEDMGLLEKPHTSAGRRPTQNAYRLYVDRMLKVGDLSKDEEQFARSYFNQRMTEVAQVCDAAANALSDLTEHIGLVATPDISNVCLVRIQLVGISEGRALAIFVTDSGMVRDAVITVPKKLRKGELEALSGELTRSVESLPLEQAPKAIEDAAKAAVERQKDVMREVFAAINRSKETKSMFLGGKQNLWRYPEYQDIHKAQQLLSFLDERTRLEEILEEAADLEFSIRIGTEVGGDALPDLSLVTATYKAGGKSIGSFGVIGPIRMNYARVLSVLRCVGGSLSGMLTDLTDPKESD